MTTEVFNDASYVETDATNRLSETASTITFTALPRNETVCLAKDFGAGYFATNSYLEGTVNISALSATLGKSFSSTFSNDPATYTSYAGFYIASGDTSNLNIYAYTNAGNVLSSYTGALNTNYTYRTGVLSSLSQYGAAFVQIFSGATCLGAAVAPRSAQDTYQYYTPVKSTNVGTAGTITGTISNVTLTQTQGSAGIDLTTGVETDTGTGRLVVYADCIVATALNVDNSETAKHVAIDEGAGFFDEYTVSDVLNITAFGGTGTLMQYFEILTVCDAAASSEALNDSQGIAVYWVSATTYKLYIHQMIGGASTFSTAGPTLNTNQPYSFTLSRSGTALTMKVWNDLVLTNFAGTSQVGSTVTWTGRAATTYRYLLPVTSYLNGTTSRSSTFTLGGVQRTGGSQSASYTSDGGFRIGGSATNSRAAYATSSGGIRLGGSATHSRSTAYIATGGFIIGGSADFSANGAQSVSYTSSGGFIIGGTAANSRSSSHTGSGGFRLGGSAAYSFTLQTNVQEIVFELYDSTGAPITGATTLTCKLRTTPGAQIYDWSDDTFKSSGWTTISADLNEIDATNLPGVYKKEIDVSNFADGRYQVFIAYSATQSQHGSIEFLVDDGQMVDEYTATNTHTALIDIASVPTAVWSKTLPL